MTLIKPFKAFVDQDLHDHLYTYYTVNELKEIISTESIPSKLKNHATNKEIFFETVKQAIKSIEND